MKSHHACSLIIVPLFLLLSISTSAQTSPPIEKQDSCPQTSVLPARLFGLTIDKVADNKKDKSKRIRESLLEQLEFIKAHSPGKPLPIVRIVLDVGNAKQTGTVMGEYVDIIKEIKGKGLAYVMAEVMDSNYFHFCTKKGKGADEQCYVERTKNYLDALGQCVDIWEIGNEINGQWAGGEEGELSGDRAPTTKQAARMDARDSVIRQVKAGYDFLEGKGKLTAVTFYFNDDGERHSWSEEGDDSEYSMKKWLQDNKGKFPGVDYVFISFYPDDNFAPGPREGERTRITPSPEKWAEIFKQIKDDYQSAQVGFGEVGAQCKYKKEGSCVVLEDEDNSECKDRECNCCLSAQRDYIREYYQDLDAKIRAALKANYEPSYEKAFVGGYFYWHFNSDVINKFADAKKVKKTKERQSLELQPAATRQTLVDAYETWK
ncbi:MAG TPA: hypothetical protein VJT09_16680 [Pyrinomonadaceae bacterium]|nr:hypothetical protein [Pyrinomonadaceae bacterium]